MAAQTKSATQPTSMKPMKTSESFTKLRSCSVGKRIDLHDQIKFGKNMRGEKMSYFVLCSL